MEMDIYDFDKTIVPFDSGSLFTLYCLLHYPWIIIYLPVIAAAALLMLLKIINFTAFKKTCFMFVPLIPLERAVKGFWNRHEKEVHKWFLKDKRSYVVISASPDFLLKEIAERLGFDHLICTRHSRRSGMIIGENCRDSEKVRRFAEEFPNTRVMDVYSDSIHHDKHIFSLAEGQCYHIVKGVPIPFDYCEMYQEKK
ncbi:MAG: haloacid dehalogenase-like hydrolase [Eubacterium sp.]